MSRDSKGRFIKGHKERAVHGKSNTRLFRIWSGMKNRCYWVDDPDYKDYGGRGIRIAGEWLLPHGRGFLNFYNWATSNGYRNNLKIDRIDNDGFYVAENCRWVTDKEQARNKRNVLKTTYNGQEVSLRDLSDMVGITFDSLRNAFIKYGQDGLLERIERHKLGLPFMHKGKRFLEISIDNKKYLLMDVADRLGIKRVKLTYMHNRARSRGDDPEKIVVDWLSKNYDLSKLSGR